MFCYVKSRENYRGESLCVRSVSTISRKHIETHKKKSLKCFNIFCLQFNLFDSAGDEATKSICLLCLYMRHGKKEAESIDVFAEIAFVRFFFLVC